MWAGWDGRGAGWAVFAESHVSLLSAKIPLALGTDNFTKK
jgi:hypothetical protein